VRLRLLVYGIEIWRGAVHHRGKVLDEPKWVLEGSEKGCLSLWKITGIYNGMSSTATDLVSASVRNRPDVTQLSVVESRCGKV